MPEISDAALPWVLFIGTSIGTLAGGALAVAVDRLLHHVIQQTKSRTKVANAQP